LIVFVEQQALSKPDSEEQNDLETPTKKSQGATPQTQEISEQVTRFRQTESNKRNWDRRIKNFAAAQVHFKTVGVLSL
jgi:hypothetical protein